jgi:hypothetical protein
MPPKRPRPTRTIGRVITATWGKKLWTGIIIDIQYYNPTMQSALYVFWNDGTIQDLNLITVKEGFTNLNYSDNVIEIGNDTIELLKHATQPKLKKIHTELLGSASPGAGAASAGAAGAGAAGAGAGAAGAGAAGAGAAGAGDHMQPESRKRTRNEERRATKGLTPKEIKDEYKHVGNYIYDPITRADIIDPSSNIGCTENCQDTNGFQTINIDLYAIFGENYGIDNPGNATINQIWPDIGGNDLNYIRKQLKWYFCFVLRYYLDYLHDFARPGGAIQDALMLLNVHKHYYCTIYRLQQLTFAFGPALNPLDTPGDNFTNLMHSDFYNRNNPYFISLNRIFEMVAYPDQNNRDMYQRRADYNENNAWDNCTYRIIRYTGYTDVFPLNCESSVYNQLLNPENTTPPNLQIKNTRYFPVFSADIIQIYSEYCTSIMGVQVVNFKELKKTVYNRNNSADNDSLIKFLISNNSHTNTILRNSVIRLDTNKKYFIGVDALSGSAKTNPITSLLNNILEYTQGNQPKSPLGGGPYPPSSLYLSHTHNGINRIVSDPLPKSGLPGEQNIPPDTRNWIHYFSTYADIIDGAATNNLLKKIVAPHSIGGLKDDDVSLPNNTELDDFLQDINYNIFFNFKRLNGVSVYTTPSCINYSLFKPQIGRTKLKINCFFEVMSDTIRGLNSDSFLNDRSVISIASVSRQMDRYTYLKDKLAATAYKTVLDFTKVVNFWCAINGIIDFNSRSARTSRNGMWVFDQINIQPNPIKIQNNLDYNTFFILNDIIAGNLASNWIATTVHIEGDDNSSEFYDTSLKFYMRTYQLRRITRTYGRPAIPLPFPLGRQEFTTQGGFRIANLGGFGKRRSKKHDVDSDIKYLKRL